MRGRIHAEWQQKTPDKFCQDFLNTPPQPPHRSKLLGSFRIAHGRAVGVIRVRMGRVVMVMIGIMAMPVTLCLMMIMALGVCVIIRMFIYSGANALNMMVVTHLREALMVFKPEHLFSVFAELAVHVVVAEENAPHPIFKCCNDLRVVIQVTSLQKFNIRKFFGYMIRNIVDSLH